MRPRFRGQVRPAACRADRAGVRPARPDALHCRPSSLHAHTVYLVDASPYIFRAHFSLPRRSPKPTQTGRRGLRFRLFPAQVDRRGEPTHLGVAFDRDLTCCFYRNQLYPAFKAKGQEPPAEPVAQLPCCEEVAAALGAATSIDDRYEANDLIATLFRGLTSAGHRAVVISSAEQVTLYDFAKQTCYDEPAVVAAFGVRPDLIVDVLVLPSNLSSRLATLAREAPVRPDLRLAYRVTNQATAALFERSGFREHPRPSHHPAATASSVVTDPKLSQDSRGSLASDSRKPPAPLLSFQTKVAPRPATLRRRHSSCMNVTSTPRPANLWEYRFGVRPEY
ncbi:MAG TPA: hypothetical protein VHR45_25510 [Thermoanaerobaculia bacterium]|nr:hypothetical protein [Thermoanaerobaculia bacterium]